MVKYYSSLRYEFKRNEIIKKLYKIQSYKESLN